MNSFVKRNIRRNVDVIVDGVHNKNVHFTGLFHKVVHSLFFAFSYARHRLFKRLEIPQIEFVLTTRCTLHCAHCANYIPLFSESTHQSYTYDEFVTDFDVLESSVDKINSVILLGGEPLLVKDLEKILEYLAARKKVRDVYVITNGTIIPSPNLFNILGKYSNIHLWMSNYTANKEIERISKHAEILELCKSKQLSIIFDENLMWNTVSMPKIHHRSKPELLNYYQRCLHPCISVIAGTIHPCPRAASFYAMKSCDFTQRDYVNLRSGLGTAQVRKNIYDFFSRNVFQSCDLCDFHEDMAKKTMIPAIQKDNHRGHQ